MQETIAVIFAAFQICLQAALVDPVQERCEIRIEVQNIECLEVREGERSFCKYNVRRFVNGVSIDVVSEIESQVPQSQEKKSLENKDLL